MASTTTSTALPKLAGGLVNVNIQPRSVHTKTHFVVSVILSLVFVLAFTAVGFHGYVAWLLSRPTVAPLSSNPEEAIGVPYETVRFPSANRRTMVDGWYLPSGTSDRTVIFSHGYGANREESWVPMYDLAKAANLQSYNVLMFDYGFVKPDHAVTGGVQETQELLGAIRLAKEKGARQVFIWGFSMGAGTALQAALQTNDITGMILDSTFLLTPDTLYHNIRQQLPLPRFPSLGLIRLFFPLVNGVSLEQIPYHKVMTSTYRFPTFLIHGEQDTKAPYQLAEEVYNNQKANPLSQLWLQPKGYHELLYVVNKKEYMRRTLAFLEDASKAGGV